MKLPSEKLLRTEPTNGMARPQRSSISGRWWRGDLGLLGEVILLVAVVAVIIGGAAFLIEEEKGERGQIAQLLARKYARVVEENTEHLIGAIDQTLLTLRQVYATQPPSDDIARWTQTSPILTDMILVAYVTDAEGRVVASSDPRPEGRNPIPARPHFRDHLGAVADHLHIGAPTLGHRSTSPYLHFSRRLLSRDGKFQGVVVLGILPERFISHAQSVELGRGFAILAGADGVIHAHGQAVGLVGKQLLEIGLRTVAAENPQHDERTNVLGRDRFVSYRRLANSPLTVVVGLDAKERSVAFFVDRNNIISASGVMTVLVLALGIGMIVNRRRISNSQRALELTLESMGQGLLMIGGDGRLQVVNRRGAELMGLPPHLTARGTDFRDIQHWQTNSGEIAQKYLLRVNGRFHLREDKNGGGQVYERTRPNGTVLEIRTDILPDGGMVRTYTDITERKRAEREVAAARDAAEAASLARSNFLAVMSHEIRTPLNGIIGAATLLEDGPLGAEERAYAEIIRNSGDHLLQLIDNILDFSKLDAMRVELEEAVFDLPAMLRGTISLLTGQAEAKHLQLTCMIDPDVPRFVRGDAARLRQILINLLGNGLKFTEKGSVSLTVVASPVRHVDAAGDQLRISFIVSDTGIGIRPDALEKLFTEFTQADNSISRRFGGSGLGLVISRRLVELMGGSMLAESQPGAGTTFRFNVLLERASAPEATPVAKFAGGSKCLNVLIVEDNPTNLLIVTRLLERMGHSVEQAMDGKAALLKATTTDYDLVLMDVMMPEMDGIAATENIRALGGRRGAVPIIGLTAGATQRDEALCRAAGMTCFTTKPITPERLADAIVNAFAIPRPVSENSDQPAALTATQEDAGALVDQQFLDALRGEIGPLTLAEILKLFLDQAGSQLAALRASATDPAQLRQHAHAIAGVARNVGLQRLGVMASQLEASGRAGTIVEPAVIEDFAKLHDETVAALQRYLSGLTATVH